MKVYLVLTHYSRFEGEPLGVFSTRESANKYVARHEEEYGWRKPRHGPPPRVLEFTVDEEVPNGP